MFCIRITAESHTQRLLQPQEQGKGHTPMMMVRYTPWRTNHRFLASNLDARYAVPVRLPDVVAESIEDNRNDFPTLQHETPRARDALASTQPSPRMNEDRIDRIRHDLETLEEPVTETDGYAQEEPSHMLQTDVVCNRCALDVDSLLLEAGSTVAKIHRSDGVPTFKEAKVLQKTTNRSSGKVETYYQEKRRMDS
ncbi:hypothetical protein LTR28_006600 [Elasticomyces elasticus]|nr:hypothetical protein LTR28_006600 [Elasticomyces elasticus]